MQTGVSVDAFDCQILKWAAVYNEPDPMVFKAIIYVESRFDQLATACPNMPCGIPSGWNANEAGCYGLMQIVPACHDDPGDAGLLANGQPNMTMDTTSTAWAWAPIFNPDVNIETGISGVAGNRAQVEKQFLFGLHRRPVHDDGRRQLQQLRQHQELHAGQLGVRHGRHLRRYQQYAMAAGYTAHGTYSP